MPTAPSSAIREALSTSYEELRQIALVGDGVHGRGTGLALLIRSGMARWMETCIAVLARPAAPAPSLRQSESHLPADVRIEVAMVLAQMALAAQAKGATTC